MDDMMIKMTRRKKPDNVAEGLMERNGGRIKGKIGARRRMRRFYSPYLFPNIWIKMNY
jgi:hypothetical protein